MPNVKSSLVPRTSLALKGKIQIASILQMSSQEFEKTIEELESNPLFQKLFSLSQEKIIHRKQFNRASLSSQFYELDEATRTIASGGQDKVEEILESKSHLVSLIRKIGQENFENFFLYDNGEYSLKEISERCEITLEEAASISDLLNKVSIEEEFMNSSAQAAVHEIYYTKVGQIIPDSTYGFTVAFFSPRMAQGIYQIDYRKLAELKKRGFLSKEEKKTLRSLISKISLINARKNSLYLLIQKIIKWQAQFMKTGSEDDLKPLTQNRIAKEIQLSPSSICRLIYARSVETPSRRELPLSFFFCSRKEWLLERLEGAMREAAGQEAEDPKDFSAGKGRCLTDNQIRDIIKSKYGISLSRRSVNQYRKELKAKRDKGKKATAGGIQGG